MLLPFGTEFIIGTGNSFQATRVGLIRLGHENKNSSNRTGIRANRTAVQGDHHIFSLGDNGSAEAACGTGKPGTTLRIVAGNGGTAIKGSEPV